MHKHIQMIQNLVDNIEEDLAYDANIKQLALLQDLSPWHFQRLFKSIVGDSLGNYIRGRKLSLAAISLIESNLSIIDIAFSVGFNSNESFTRSFKDYFKYSPKEFRKKKPRVLINKKPQLTDELLEHITKGMYQEPKILNMQEQLIVGVKSQIPSPFIPRAQICELVAEHWFSLFEQEYKIKNKIPHTYFALSISPTGDFTEEMLTYIAGVPVNIKENIPKDMTTYSIKKQKVAIFDIHTDIDEDTSQKTIDYIYGYWLPTSKYKRGLGDDYELFENVIDFRTGDFSTKYVIPILDLEEEIRE